MSYVENIFYDYIKKLLVGGLIILSNKRFITYITSVIIISAALTLAALIQVNYAETLDIYKILFDLELAICVSLVLIGIYTLKTNVLKEEHILYAFLVCGLFFFFYFTTDFSLIIGTVFIYAGFYSWIITLNIAMFLGIRDFIVSWPGWVISLGDEPGRIFFQPIIILAAIGVTIWFTYDLFTGELYIIEILSMLTAFIILYTIFILRKAYNDSLIASILSIFFLTLLYHLFVRGAEGATGFLIIDVFIIILITIMSAQGITGLIAGRKHSIYYWDSLIQIMLGFMLSYHLLAIQITLRTGLGQLFSLYHDIAFGFGSIMIFFILIAYVSSPHFRRISQRQINPEVIMNKVSEYAKEYVSKATKTLKYGWKFEVKKHKDDEEEL